MSSVLLAQRRGLEPLAVVYLESSQVEEGLYTVGEACEALDADKVDMIGSNALVVVEPVLADLLLVILVQVVETERMVARVEPLSCDGSA